MSCSIVPNIKNTRGEWVPSKLFTDLLEETKDRELTKKLYEYAFSDEFINHFGSWITNKNLNGLDENGEPQFDQLVTKKQFDEGWGEYKTYYAPVLYEDPVEFDLEEESYRFQALIDTKYKALKNLQAASREFEHTDYRKFEEINYRIRALQSEIQTLENVRVRPTQVDQLDNLAQKDYKQLTEMFADGNVSKNEIAYANKIINMWTDVRRNMMEGEDVSDTDAEQTVNNIEGMFRQIQDKYLRPAQMKQVNKIADYANQEEGSLNPIIDDVTNRIAIKDIGAGRREILNITNSGRLIGDVMGIIKKDAHQRSRDEYNAQIEKLYELDRKKQEAFKEKGLTDAVFDQLDRKGNPTSNNVFRYSQGWFDDKSKAIKEGWSKYVDFVSKNAITMDPRKLFNDSHAADEAEMPDDYVYKNTHTADERTKRINILKRHMGSEAVDRMIEEMSKDLEDWKQRREQVYQVYKAQGLNQTDLDQSMRKWLNENSPFQAMDQRVDKGAKRTSTGYVNYNKGNSLIRDIPRRYYTDKDGNKTKETDYYDKNFETIANDERLLNYYDKMTELINNYTKYLSSRQRRQFQVNSLPFVQKQFAEKVAEGNWQHGLNDVWNQYQRGVQMSDTANNTKDDRKLSDPIQSKEQIITDRINEKITQKQVENNRKLTNQEIEDIQSEARKEISEEQNSDRTAVMESYLAATIGYKHMTKIETDMNILESVIEDGLQILDGKDEQTKISDFGNQRPHLEEGLDNMKQLTKFFVDDYYGQSFNEMSGNDQVKEKNEDGEIQSRKRKVFTRDERKRKEVLDERRQELQKQLDEWKEIRADKSGTSEQQQQRANNAIVRLNKMITDTDAEIDGLGKTPSASGYIKNALKYLQIHTMGYNFFSAFATIGFATVSNITEAGDGRSFTGKKLRKAMGMVLQSVLKNGTLNTFETDTAKKVRSIVDTFNFSATETSEIGQDGTAISRQNNDTGFKAFLKRGLPYKAQQHAEYIAQAPIVIARMKTLTVNDKEGNERELWDAFDTEGNWKTEEFGENTEYNGDPSNPAHNKGRSSLKSNIDELIAKNHGDYDGELGTKVQDHILKQTLTQFRTWLFESAASRFQARVPNKRLGYEVKGRFRSGLGVIGLSGDAGVNNIDQTIFNTKQLLRKVTFRNTEFETLYDEVDAANMRANLNELLVATSLFGVAIMLKGLDDDDDQSGVSTYLTNWLNRVQNDILMYTNPFSAYEILKEPIAGFNLVEQVYDWTESAFLFMSGDDEIDRGPYEDQSRFLRETLSLFPMLTEIKKQVDLLNTERGNSGISGMITEDDSE